MIQALRYKNIRSLQNRALTNLLLILLVSIPLLVISIFTLRSLQTERIVSEQQAERHYDWVLETVDKSLQSHIENQIERYFSEFKTILRAGEDFRGKVMININLDLVAVYTFDGERIFPPDSQRAMFSEMRLVQQIRPDVSLIFKQKELPLTYRSLITHESGYKLLACHQFNQQLICFLFSPYGLSEWINDALSITALPEGLQTSVVVPGVSQSTIYSTAAVNAQSKNTNLLAKKSMGGKFAEWQLLLYGNQENEKKDHLLLFSVLLFPVFLLLLGCGYGLYRIEKIRSHQAMEQKQFSAELAHEIRTPLANIRLYIDLIKQSDALKKQKYHSVLVSEIDRLSLLVDNAILLARPEYATPDSYFQLAGPDSLIRIILNTMAPILKESDCDVHYELMVGGDWYFDSDALQRLLINLLDNSRKYAKGCQIYIKTSLVDGNIVVDYSDEGPGLPKSLWEKIQSTDDKRINDGGQGFGLGLRVCLRLCQRSGGRMEKLTTHVGTHFRCMLPTIKQAKEVNYAYSNRR